MAKPNINISLKSYDSLFKTDNEKNTEEIKYVAITELKPHEQHPYKVLVDSSMNDLIKDIQQCGILQPVIVRPHPDGGYEIISGHRRVKACELAGIHEIPIIVKHLDDDQAAIALVNSNSHRENLLPSEKAFAYKLKLDAMKRQGARSDLTSGQIGQKLKTSVEIIGEANNESYKQIQRYIRLTELIDPILELVDNGKIAMNAAVELSYLGSREQSEVFKAIEQEDTAPSIAQAKKMRCFSQEGRLNPDVIASIMQEQKPEKLKVTIDEDKLRKYFPKNYSKQQIEDTVIKLLEAWYRKRRQQIER